LRVGAIDQRVPEDVALSAIRNFVGNFGRVPTAEAWTAARMTPSEKTIRRRFGNFQAAVTAATTDR
jgi:Homing endonuclease associated repeat